MEVQFHAFLTLALDKGEWSASSPSRFTPRERAPGTHWIGGWVRSGHGGEEKNSQLLPGLEPPNHPARSTAPKLNFLTTFNAAPPQTKLTINSIVQSPFKEADIRLAGQEISHLLWKSVYQCS